MTPFATKVLSQDRTAIAPDGSDVHLLLSLAGGGMAQFALSAGKVSRAIAHKTVEEIWYILSGSGEMWRKQGGREEIVALAPGVCLTVPLGAHFQFRASPNEDVAAIGVTMPPWPGDHEAYVVPGPWEPTG